MSIYEWKSIEYLCTVHVFNKVSKSSILLHSQYTYVHYVFHLSLCKSKTFLPNAVLCMYCILQSQFLKQMDLLSFLY